MNDDKETQQLREWAAEKMEWRRSTTPIQDFHTGMVTDEPSYVNEHGEHEMFINEYHPDNPSTGQIWMLVDVMVNLGFELRLYCPVGIKYQYCCYFIDGSESMDGNPCLAILKAARDTED